MGHKLKMYDMNAFKSALHILIVRSSLDWTPSHIWSCILFSQAGGRLWSHWWHQR